MVSKKTYARQSGSCGDTSRISQESKTEDTIVELDPKKTGNLKEFKSSGKILDDSVIAELLWDCLKEGDHEEFVELVVGHLSARNKTKICRESEISRSTFYNLLKSKNPTIKTLAKVISSFVKEE